MSNRFGIYPATLSPASGGDINLAQLDSHSFSPGQSKAPYTPGGGLDRVHVGLATARPMHRLSTRDLDTVFTRISPTVGLAIPNGAVFRYQQRLCEGGFQTGTNHIQRAVAKGFVKPGTLSASEGDSEGSSVSLDFYSLSVDGFTDPDVKTGSIDLAAAPTPSFSSRFFFGPVTLGGAKLPGIASHSVDFGIECDSKLFDFVFPTCVAITARNPVITFSGPNAALDVTLNSFANNLASPLVLYHRRGAHGQARVSDVTTSHMSITAAAGEWSVSEESVSGQGDGTFSFQVMVTGTLAVSVAAAVSIS